MREILFRGKRVDNSGWVYGYFVNQYGANQIYLPNDTDDDGFDKRHITPETVGQYTGLTDKNGKKIFEGDIIELHTLDTNDRRRAVCLYGEFREEEDELYLGWYIHYSGSDGTFDSSLVQENKELMNLAEIIGNIHDNPELLEVKE